MPLPDPTTALLDLVAGWLEHVEACVETGEQPRDAFEADYFDDGEAVDPAVYDAWRAHYDEAYLELVQDLAVRAETLLLDDGGGAALTPTEFVRLELLPLLSLPGERREATP